MSNGMDSQGVATGESMMPDWVEQLRERGDHWFKRHGVPTPRIEAWKYTPLRGLETRLEAAPEARSNAAAPAGLPLAVEGARCVTLVDGACTDAGQGWPDGVTVLPLADALVDGHLDEWADWMAASAVERPGDALAALNDARLEHGLFVSVADGVDAGRLLLEWCSSGDRVARNGRLVVVLGEDARLALVERHGGDATGESGAVLNLVGQLRLGERSELLHSRLQDLPGNAWLITRYVAEQHRGSHWDYTGLELGGGLVRHDLASRLEGPGARCDMNGAYLPAGDSHVDHHLAIEHRAEHCASSQFFRGVVDDRAHAVFNGRVHVLPGADGTEARQSNANLLLSGQAEVDTKPELEIEADEVVASHGATVGQLDEEAVFYLRSRGLDETQARELLIGAFCQAALDRIPDPAARTALTARLAERTGMAA